MLTLKLGVKMGFERDSVDIEPTPEDFLQSGDTGCWRETWTVIFQSLEIQARRPKLLKVSGVSQIGLLY